MPVDKVVNLAPVTNIIEMTDEMEPDIEIILDDDGSAVVEINPEDDDVDFYSNLAEVIDDNELTRSLPSYWHCLRRIDLPAVSGKRCIPTD
jgi:hypothetical protein